MFPFQKILFPVDFSRRSEGAAHAVRAMAREFHAEVTALHVVESASADSAYEVSIAQARDKMEILIAKDLRDCKVQSFCERGDPARVIADYARHGQFDLIMMPTHGYGPFRRFLLGSITAKVLHDANCPVWTASHLENWPAVERVVLRQILVAIDFGPRSLCALQLAGQIGARFDAGISVAHVLAAGDYRSEDCRSEMRQSALKQVEEQLRTLRITATATLLDGSPGSAISEAADRMNADLIVIGRTHASDTQGQLGSNAYAIIARSPCPVLSV
jgi:nucleotide-binding universal stress UspA family protein